MQTFRFILLFLNCVFKFQKGERLASIGLLVYFIWTGLTGFFGLFFLLCQIPDEAGRKQSAFG